MARHRSSRGRVANFFTLEGWGVVMACAALIALAICIILKAQQHG